MQPVAARSYHAVHLPAPDDFDFWREQARALVRRDVPPEQVTWIEPGAAGDLFAAGKSDGCDRPMPVDGSDERPVRANRAFLKLASNAALHRDPQRFALLYRLLWRLQTNLCLLEDRVDPDVLRLEELDKAVRRDSHKMHAFVRFRHVACSDEEEAGEHYVAWFEPEHHILRANAGFFVRRFANMRWSILTPRGSLHWDGDSLAEGPPARREDAPTGDPAEDLWRTYYASIFNPARLKIGAMLKEMPKKYWKNMPEAVLIPDLVAGAQSREAQMVERGAFEEQERPASLDEVAVAIDWCRRCSIGSLQNRAVTGEGLRNGDEGFSGLMIVGEQPGDQEDIFGRPFVGPAGRLLDTHLERAGIKREQAWVTNAVKHFKFVQRGKRRLHQSPEAKEIDICRWWLESERALVKPRLVLALGASAARGLLGKTVSISKARGQSHRLEDGSELWVTAHPSYLLRLEGESRSKHERLFEADLGMVAVRLVELTR